MSTIKVHTLKIQEIYFMQQINEEKTFEFRKNDRDFKVDDVIKLKELTYNGVEWYETGRYAICMITSVLENYEGIKEGYAILSTKLLRVGGEI